MARDRIGDLPPRYSFMLNPYSDVRLSKCPKCERLTHLRKFALLIHVTGWGPLALGKTCRYCTPCELIMAHRDELEAELARDPAPFTPTDEDRGYLVLGTVDKKVWQKGRSGSGNTFDDIMKHTAQFKKYYDLHVEPGGWRPAKEE